MVCRMVFAAAICTIIPAADHSRSGSESQSERESEKRDQAAPKSAAASRR